MEDKNIILAPSARHMRNLMINLDDLVGELETRLEILEALTDGLGLEDYLSNPLTCTCGDCVQVTKAIRKEVNDHYRSFQYDLLNRDEVKRLFKEHSITGDKQAQDIVPYFKVIELFGARAAKFAYAPDYDNMLTLKNGKWEKSKTKRNDKQNRFFTYDEFLKCAIYYNVIFYNRIDSEKIFTPNEIKRGCIEPPKKKPQSKA